MSTCCQGRAITCCLDDCPEEKGHADADTALMRRALEALEECRIVVRKYADYIESAGEDIENGQIYRSAGQVIHDLNERLLRE